MSLNTTEVRIKVTLLSEKWKPRRRTMRSKLDVKRQ